MLTNISMTVLISPLIKRSETMQYVRPFDNVKTFDTEFSSYRAQFISSREKELTINSRIEQTSRNRGPAQRKRPLHRFSAPAIRVRPQPNVALYRSLPNPSRHRSD